MNALNSPILIIACICIPSILKPVYTENSLDCEWCVETEEKSSSGSSQCEVIYYVSESFERANESQCLEIYDFSLYRVYGNTTKANVSVQDACSIDVPPSELGIALTWSVEGDYVKDMEHFLVSITKIYITEKCATKDLVVIIKPDLTGSLTNGKIRFHYVYKGSDGLFCLHFGGSYSVSIRTGVGCTSSKGSTMFPENFCGEELPIRKSISNTMIYLILSGIVAILVTIGIILILIKRRRKDKDCESEVNMLLLLNPQISEGQLMERMNTVATKISKLPGLKVDCNFWNRSQSQYDWVNNALQKADIVIIVCTEDRTEEPTNDTFDIWVSRLLTGNFSRDIVIVHPPEIHHHNRCPFNRDNYHVTKIYGDAEKDTQVLKKKICKIVRRRPTRPEVRPLVPQNGEAESRPTVPTEV